MTIALTVLTIQAQVSNTATPIYLDENAPIEQRVEDALSRMTTAE